MKKFLPIAFAFLALLFSCDKEEGFPDSISLNKTELSIEVDEEETLTVIFEPEDAPNKYVIWTCSDDEVVHLWGGEVRGLSPGVATVTARCGSAEASCKVTVRKKPLKVSITDLAVKRETGDNYKVTLSCKVSVLNAEDDYCDVKFYLATSASGSLGSPVYTRNTSTFFCSHPDSPYSATGLAQNLKPYQTYYLAVAVSVDGGTFWSEGRHEFSVLQMNPVDLGMVVNGYKVLWGDRNLFAESTSSSGKYYPWGGLESTDGTASSYTYTDNPSILPLSRDIAHIELGGNWRMPNAAEMTALINKCTLTSGGVGCKLTSTNGNSITIPRSRRLVDGDRSRVDEGCYWTSSIDPSYSSYAQTMEISFYGDDLRVELYSLPRKQALTIRPVYAVPF